jgi:hypothetical protein
MFSQPWVLSFCVGLLSLSQEIIWVRVVGFAMRGLPIAFAFVLLLFLVGIALGAAIGRWLCTGASDLYRASSITLAFAAVADALTIPALAMVAASGSLVVLVSAAMIVLTAMLKSILFPIAHHLGSQQAGPRLGRSISKVYFGNIAGSTLGPLVAGYVLLQLFSAEQCMAIVSVGTGVLALVAAAAAQPRQWAAPTLGLFVAASLALALLGGRLQLMPELAAGIGDQPGVERYAMIQNRHGIVHAAPDGGPGDVVYGGNIYDGRAIVEMERDANWLDRGTIMLAAHPNPEWVLVVGMSVGSWTKMLLASPRIRELHVVEINPAYIQLLKGYPQLAGLLEDPRVRIHIDDARRWMRRHPEERFDLIIQNTTFYWRANATNLLSFEFMSQVLGHLKPGGIVGINTTTSDDVVFTARKAFPHTAIFKSFVYGSNRPFPPSSPEAAARLRELTLNGAPLLPAQTFEPGATAGRMLATWFDVRPEARMSGRFTPGLISDQNLRVEYLHGRMHDRYPGPSAALEKARAWLSVEVPQ